MNIFYGRGVEWVNKDTALKYNVVHGNIKRLPKEFSWIYVEVYYPR